MRHARPFHLEESGGTVINLDSTINASAQLGVIRPEARGLLSRDPRHREPTHDS